jgi:hypothetical protein
MTKYIGVYWYNRRATLAEAGEQLLGFLKVVRDHNPKLFERFCKGANSKRVALKSEIDLEYESVLKLFNKKYKPNDVPEQAFFASAWNGEPDDFNSASIEASLGSSESKLWPNNCIINLPHRGPQAEYYADPDNQKALLDIMIEYWNPESYMIDGKEVEIKPQKGDRGSTFRNLFQ